MNKLSKFDNVSIAVIGDVMLDSYWYGDTQRISPEAPVPVVKVGDIDQRPGGAANVALNISSLGAKVKLFGLTGIDNDSKELDKCLLEHGIENGVIKDKDLQTINKLRILCQSQQLLRLDFEHVYQNVDKTILQQKFVQSLADTKLVIASDYAKGTLTNLPEIISKCREQQTPILIDPKGSDYSKYRGATMLTPNLKEFELVMGHSETESLFLEKGQQMLVDYQLENLLVTRGADGMTLFRESNEPFHLPAQAKSVYDVTGAGDTVIGVLSTCLAADINIEHSLELANFAAGIVVGQVGAATVNAKELNEFYKSQRNSHSNCFIDKIQSHKKHNELYHIEFCYESELTAIKLHQLMQLKQQGLFIYVAINELASFETKQRARDVLGQIDFIDDSSSISEHEYNSLRYGAVASI